MRISTTTTRIPEICVSFSPSLLLSLSPSCQLAGPIRGKNTPKFVAIFPSFPHLKKSAFLKYLT